MQGPNQFKQSGEKGLLDMKYNPMVMSVEIDQSSAGSLVAGQAVKMVDSAGGVPKVVECSSDADDVFGFIIYDIKSQKFSAYDKCEVAFFKGSIMYMQSSAAIARYAEVAIVLAGQKIVTASTGKRIVGRALDKATAADQLVRVIVNLPSPLA